MLMKGLGTIELFLITFLIIYLKNKISDSFITSLVLKKTLEPLDSNARVIKLNS